MPAVLVIGYAELAVSSPAMATNCAYPQNDSQAELACVAG